MRQAAGSSFCQLIEVRVLPWIEPLVDHRSIELKHDLAVLVLARWIIPLVLGDELLRLRDDDRIERRTPLSIGSCRQLLLDLRVLSEIVPGLVAGSETPGC